MHYVQFRIIPVKECPETSTDVMYIHVHVQIMAVSSNNEDQFRLFNELYFWFKKSLQNKLDS